jgi:hypothetical protein
LSFSINACISGVDSGNLISFVIDAAFSNNGVALASSDVLRFDISFIRDVIFSLNFSFSGRFKIKSWTLNGIANDSG